MFSKIFIAGLTSLILATSVSSQGLYSKGSAVLQVDGRSYQKLVAMSNQVSVGLIGCETEGLKLTYNSR